MYRETTSCNKIRGVLEAFGWLTYISTVQSMASCICLDKLLPHDYLSVACAVFPFHKRNHKIVAC